MELVLSEASQQLCHFLITNSKSVFGTSPFNAGSARAAVVAASAVALSVKPTWLGKHAHKNNTTAVRDESKYFDDYYNNQSEVEKAALELF
jgi:hypothetical protein